MRDIYGDAAYLDVTVIVEDRLWSPPDVMQCYTESGVAQIPFVLDIMYLTGSRKEAKINMNPRPQTAAGMNCESLIVLQADWV